MVDKSATRRLNINIVLLQRAVVVSSVESWPALSLPLCPSPNFVHQFPPLKWSPASCHLHSLSLLHFLHNSDCPAEPLHFIRLSLMGLFYLLNLATNSTIKVCKSHWKIPAPNSKSEAGSRFCVLDND